MIIDIPKPIRYTDAEQYLMHVESDVEAARKLVQIAYSTAPWTKTGHEEILLEDMAMALTALADRLESLRKIVGVSLPSTIDFPKTIGFGKPSSPEAIDDLNKKIEEYKAWKP